jgi:ribonuclease D
MLKSSHEESTPLKIISKEEISKLPVVHYKGEIVVVNTTKDAEKCTQEMMLETVFGFDTETKPVFVSGKTNKIALIQIAGENKVWVFQVHEFEIGKLFKKFLESDTYLKVGVAIRDDIKKIYKDTGVKAGGMFELSTLSKSIGLSECGLRTLTAKVFGHKLSKKQQTSNWEASPLSEAQIIYAATDAWICRKLYLKMMNAKNKID